jgi:MFS family permease
VFDIFPPEKRGKMTGLLGAVFGSASVFGPLIGAFLTDNLSWHWVFYVNVPIGILSLFFVVTSYKESPERSKERIDWGGAITLVAAVVSLMFALELGGNEFSWSSWQIIGLFASFFLFFISFLSIERKAAEPIISFWMFKSPLFASAQALAFLYGSAFIILTILIPIFVQAVYGGSATNAGLILTPLMLGSVAGSAVAGIRMTKNSYRSIMWLSIISFIIGMALLATMGPDTSRWLLTLYMVISGFGVGFSFSLLPNATIHKLDPRYRGTANSTNAFFRSLGMTIGITVFGTLQTKFFSSNIESAFQGQSGGGFPTGDPRSLFEPEMREKIPDFVLDKITGAMSDSITATFAYALIPLVIALVFVYLMGSSRLEVPGKQENQ